MTTYKTPSTTAWYSVSVLAVAYMLSFVDRSILSLMVGPIRADLNLSDTEFSLLHGLAFAIFYTLLGVPIARLADRTNRRNLIAIGIAFWSLMTAVCGLARNFTQLFLARVGVGIGEATLSPAAYSMIADLFPKEKLGRALSIYSSGVYIGIGLSFILGGVLIESITNAGGLELPLVGHLKAWQATFMIVGLPGILVALWMMTLTEPLRGHGHAVKGVPVAEVFDHFKQNASTYCLHFIGFSMVTLLYNSILSWSAEFFIRIHSVSRSEIGMQLGLIILVFGSAGIICGGLLSDYFSRKGHSDAPIRAALCGLIALVPLAVVAPLMESPGLSLLLFCPLMFAGSFPFGPAATAIQLVSPAQMRAQFSAFYLLFVNLAGIGLGATVTALVTDFVFADDMKLHYSMSVVSGVGGVLAIGILILALKPFAATVEANELSAKAVSP